MLTISKNASSFHYMSWPCLWNLI